MALTLVLNPNARRPRLKPPCMDGLQEAIGPHSKIHVTKSLEDLDHLMKEWKVPRRVSNVEKEIEKTLCFYGGDGSIAQGLTSLIRHQGEDCVIPPVLAIRGGTMNMLSHVLGLSEKVDRTLNRWKRGELTRIQEIPLLRVEVEGQKPQYGFVFAWGVGYRVLREYYQRSTFPDVADALAVVLRTFASTLHPNADSTAMFRSEKLKIKMDGKTMADFGFRALTVGTISRVSLGIRPFPPEPITTEGFHVSGNGMSIYQVAWHAPTLLFGFGDQRKLEATKDRKLLTGTHVKELSCELPEGFTMDGEVFELSKRTKVRISLGPTVRFWTK